MRTSFTRWLSLFFLSFALAGCGSKINQTNYDKIQNEMTVAQVEAILGKPTETSGGSFIGISGQTSTWKDESGMITVKFLNGKVVGKEFSKTVK